MRVCLFVCVCATVRACECACVSTPKLRIKNHRHEMKLE